MVERQEEAEGADILGKCSPGDPSQALNDTETPVLSPPLMGPQVGLGGKVSLNKAPAQRARGRAGRGGAGPGLPGRGLWAGPACGAGPQLHLQERTIMLVSCSTLALRPT